MDQSLGPQSPRAADWFDDDGPQISVEEWRILVAADPELTPDSNNHALNLVLWRGPSADAEAWLAWSEPGQIFTKYPNRALVAKMLQLAAQLGARVQGDESEFYTNSSQVPED